LPSARLHVDARRPVHLHERFGDEDLAGGAVDRVGETIPVEVHERLSGRTA